MKEKRNFLIGIILSGILGWTLGFLRLPFLEKNFSFLLGFIACLALVLLGLLIMYIWRKKSSTSSTFQKKSFRSFATLLLILVGGFGSSFLFFQQNKFSKIQANQQNKKLAEQFELEATTRKSNALILMNNLFDKIEEELKSKPKRILSDQMIERITALNYSFKPYQYFDGEKFSEKKWSPERGQLLLSLAKMKIDSISFSQIKSKTSFLGADLFEADLSGTDLSGVDLRQANLENVILTGAKLNNADLTNSSIKSAHLNKVILQKSKLQNVNLQWANLDEANINEANFNGADLRNAKLRAVESKETNFTWANLTGVFLNNADLTNANFKGANLGRASLVKANLTKTNLFLVNLVDINLTNAKLIDTNLDRTTIGNTNWFEKLTDWQTVGEDEIKKKYTIEYHTPTQIYFLKKK